MDEMGLYQADKMNRLHRAMSESCDAARLGQICQLLGIDYSKLPGAATRDKIRELLLHLNRRGRLDDLLEICPQQADLRQDRPFTGELLAFVRRSSWQDLSQILATRFSLQDLKQLAFCLGIDFENIPGPHLIFGSAHNLSERSKQWLDGLGIDYARMSVQDIEQCLNKVWVEGFVKACEGRVDRERTAAICFQLRPDAFE